MNTPLPPVSPPTRGHLKDCRKGIMQAPKSPRKPEKDEASARREGSVFRKMSPLIKTTKQVANRKTLREKSSQKIQIGQRFSITLGALITVLSLFILLIGPPAFQLITQVEARNKQYAELQQLKQENQRLKEENQDWNDPEYIKQQARERLGFVDPGEVRYTVIDPGSDYHRDSRSQQNKAPKRPWYLEIANSSENIGRKLDPVDNQQGGKAGSQSSKQELKQNESDSQGQN